MTTRNTETKTISGSARLLPLLPHSLSLSRLALGLCFPFVPSGWRVGVVVLAAFTDFADGAISRWLRVDGGVGRYLDVLADKIFLLGVLVTLLAEGTISAGNIILLGLRDLVVLLGTGWVLIARGRSELAHLTPSTLGKLTTAAQLVYILIVVFSGQPHPVVFVPVAILSGLAGVDYLLRHAARPRQVLPPSN
jgi:phosphatidylglycerophosphate synthase